MEDSRNANNPEGGEISIKEIILKIRSIISYLLRSWWLIVLFSIVGASIGFTLAYLSKLKYRAELTFVMEDNSSSNPLSKYASLAGQFGVDLGEGSGSGLFQGDNIMEFLRSRLLIQKSLLSVMMVDGKKETLAERYIEINDLRKGWEKSEVLANVHFPVDADRSKFTIVQDSLLQVFHQTILKNHLLIDRPDEKLNFISVKFTSPSELFSKVFVENLVKEALSFYIDTKTRRTRSSVDKLQGQADSLEILLNRKTYSAAAVQDLNQNPARQAASISSELALRDKLILQTMYGEVIKNLEMSKIAMTQETPLVQIIDLPVLPLEKVKLSKLKAILIGGVGGAFLTIIWLIIRKIYKAIMNF